MARFTGKVAIVTGSSFGIGRATALLLARDGARVTINGRKEERLEETKRLLIASGVPAEHINVVKADVTSEEDQKTIIDSTIEKFGKLDILVNNAGATIPDANGKKKTEEGLDTFVKTIETNVQSAIGMTQKAREHLRKSGGEIVNVSGIGAVPMANPNRPYYSVSKAALNQYSRSAAIDLIADDIRVNTVSPGLVTSGFVSAAGVPEAAARKLFADAAAHPECIPRGFCGNADDVAHAIAFLADRTVSSYIIGQEIIVDGGTTLVMGFTAHNMAAARRNT